MSHLSAPRSAKHGPDGLYFLPSPFFDSADAAPSASAEEVRGTPVQSSSRRPPKAMRRLARPPFSPPSPNPKHLVQDYVDKGKGKERPRRARRSSVVSQDLSAADDLARREQDKRGPVASTSSSSDTFSPSSYSYPASGAAAHISARQLPASSSNAMPALNSGASFTIASLQSVASARAGSEVLSSIEALFGSAATALAVQSAASASAAASPTLAVGMSSIRPTSAASASSGATPASSSTSPSAPGSTQPGTSSSTSHALRNKLVPAIVIPVCFLLLVLILVFCLRRRSKKRVAEIESPVFGNRAIVRGGPYGGTGSAGGMTQHSDGSSHTSFQTSDSAIGVALSGPEPRTRWGRRSLTDIFAGRNRRSGHSSFGGGPAPELIAPEDPMPVTPEFGMSMSQAGLYPAYQPGMPRPVAGYQHDEFSSPSVRSVPTPTIQQHRQSDASEWTASTEPEDEYGSDGTESVYPARDDDVPPPPPVPATWLYRETAGASRVTQGTQGTATGESNYYSSRSDAGSDTTTRENRN